MVWFPSMITKTIFSPKAPLMCLLDRCHYIKSFKEIHALLVTCGIFQDRFVQTKVIDFFGRSGNFQYAYDLLYQIQLQCPFTCFPFNSLIAAYAGSSKMPHLAILVFKRLLADGFAPDMYTFPVVLKSCAKFIGVGEGKQVHGVVVKMGFLCDLYVQNALVHVYSVCSECEDASKLFNEMPVRDVVSWTGLISGCVRGGSFCEAVNWFLKMDVEPNAATLVSVLVACGRLGDWKMGKGMHGMICKREFELDLVVGNALIDMYVKCQCLDDAKHVFDQIPRRDVMAWTSMISGLVQCKRPKEALELFHIMQASGVEPDKVVLATVLSACASLGALDYGRWIHEYIKRWGIESDTHIGTAMVDMYAKCGCLDTALQTFHGMHNKNIYSWNALLGGLAMHGHGKEALNHFTQMVKIGIRPNEVTFLAILSACCHSGLVEEGHRYFDHMTRVYNLAPKIEHYGCMVDLLGRAGLLDEAQDLIRAMPMEPDVLIWGAMLSACKAHGDVKLSQQILRNLLELQSHDSGVYVLLSNIYATNDRWEDATRLRSLMKVKGIRKAPGSSVVEVNGQTHEFLAGDSDHSQLGEIHLMLNTLMKPANLERYASEDSGKLP
eukprot:TRINITY_DN11622_c0_g2_i4.p1 TRINITY_DN11622_c0_g2~~TRINITY_DN11622_c0_g2_i4.p1  ORF type:complete len:608 (+),score=101.42 TRINITY_DN11622_c0_g2_i4:232-2055(+)